MNKRGLSAAVVTIILVVIAIAIAMLVGTLTQARIGTFARSESIKVIEASAYQLSDCIYVVAKVKNDGSSDVINIQVSAKASTTSVSVGSIAELKVGAEGSVSNCVDLPAGRGDMIVVEASGIAKGSNGPVLHAISIPIV